MRKTIVLLCVALLVLLLSNNSPQAQTQFSQEQLNAWQAIAETYYQEGVDENYMLGQLADYPPMWGYSNPGLIQPGMIAPDFMLYDLNNQPMTLSQFKGNAFVVHITGSWY